MWLDSLVFFGLFHNIVIHHILLVIYNFLLYFVKNIYNWTFKSSAWKGWIYPVEACSVFEAECATIVKKKLTLQKVSGQFLVIFQMWFYMLTFMKLEPIMHERKFSILNVVSYGF